MQYNPRKAVKRRHDIDLCRRSLVLMQHTIEGRLNCARAYLSDFPLQLVLQSVDKRFERAFTGDEYSASFCAQEMDDIRQCLEELAQEVAQNIRSVNGEINHALRRMQDRLDDAEDATAEPSHRVAIFFKKMKCECSTRSVTAATKRHGAVTQTLLHDSGHRTGDQRPGAAASSITSAVEQGP